ncbi:MAG: alkaline phosphatase family protein [Gemmatimonadota bacterium]
MSGIRKVIVIGLDGLEPKIVGRMLEEGSLPNLARLGAQGGWSTVRTTFPAQTPVAWSSFATGTNPGGHGIFDFVSRDPNTYLPDLALNRYEQKSSFLPPKAVNLRRGTPMWELLGDAGIGATVIRCPCTYPPDRLKGRMLSGMGVPDLRGGLGTSTFYTDEGDVPPQESENVVPLKANGTAEIRTHLIGPRNPKVGEDVHLDIVIVPDPAARKVTIRSSGDPGELDVREGEWSDWLKVKFKVGMLQSIGGMLRFHLTRVEPHLELYASPINFTPEAPMFPISAPWDYAGELQRHVGTYYTTGMVEDHTGLTNGRFGEASYLAQCDDVLREREAMMLYELDRFDEGLFYCLFDTPDRVQHMFWRFGEPEHPANGDPGECDAWGGVIEDHYRKCDTIVGRALEHADDRTLFVALSDHGFNSFQRGVHLNTWLHDHGFLALKDGVEPGEEAGDFFRAVDWERTRAYAVGLGSLYLNLAGREASGIVKPDEAEALTAEIAAGLTGLVDEDRGAVAISRVVSREDVYSGDCASDSPDLVACFGEGYRVSWGTALGGVPAGHFEDNTKRWGGDHIIDPDFVPGVLFMNRPFAGEGASLVDLAPTVMEALGAEKGPKMEGASLLT